ncbi:hypothetical protein DXG03_000501 [Asterophora parasitica]|uniref:Uncharacterized protein n=1 Tax=Asterophora parasitica TaxID=117018 RepID=A0A9P7G6G3_9AGAR|nr:hypothetical protein DXG03_000501 [Asterophora parasitica]
MWLGNSMNPNNTYLYTIEVNLEHFSTSTTLSNSIIFCKYGLPNNETRPGGILTTLTYVSSSASSTTFRILTDDITALYLSTNLAVCNRFLNVSSVTPEPYPYPTGGVPLPIQAVQYYRASSVVLTLDGYNNTAALLPLGSQPDTFLPGGTDTNLLECLNDTIGRSVILVDESHPLSSAAIFGIISASIIGALLLVCLACTLLEERRRRRAAKKRMSDPSPGGTVNVDGVGVGVVAPPPPAAAPPIPSSPPQYKVTSAEEWADVGLAYAYDDSVSLIRNARAIDGAVGDEWPPPRKYASGSSSWRWGRGSVKADAENIELRTPAKT